MNSEVIGNFAQSLRGSLIGRDHADYDDVRKLYNGMIDKRPLLIARCIDVADVIAAVNFGRDNRLAIAIRGGGHNGPGLGSVDDGLAIDMSAMKGVRVDPLARTARVAAGCTQGDLDHATHAFGLATPAGIISTTGIAGLTLSGGHGYLSRKYGLTIDNLIEADIVLADGTFRHGQQGGRCGPALGAARRWRQLRRGHELSVSASPGQDGFRRTDRVGSAACAHDHAALSRVPAGGDRGPRGFPGIEDGGVICAVPAGTLG